MSVIENCRDMLTRFYSLQCIDLAHKEPQLEKSNSMVENPAEKCTATDMDSGEYVHSGSKEGPLWPLKPCRFSCRFHSFN